MSSRRLSSPRPPTVDITKVPDFNKVSLGAVFIAVTAPALGY